MLRYALGLTIALAASPVQAQDMQALALEGKGVMKAFGTALKKELVGAMKSGGPTKAVGVCNVKAPQIADQVSGTSGWSVARSSHKLRNQANMADAFTSAAIDKFLKREAMGETTGKMVETAIVEENGKKVFRMVKAIPTQGVCLACHGTNIKPDVEAILKKHYPDDQATGFKPGKMRGVFTLKKILN